jgi:hypothetical protein
MTVLLFLLFLLLLLLQLLSGGSVDGAAYLAEGKADIAFNWSGEDSSCWRATQLRQANNAAAVIGTSTACSQGQSTRC